MRILVIAITFVWCGLVLGISFIATPLKFLAPNITLELGLGIGQLVFGFLNKIEMGLALALLILLVRLKPGKMCAIVLSISIVVIFVQTFFLLPILEHRLDLILAGNPPAESYHHMVYIAVEIVKVASLVLGGTLFTRDQL